MNVLTSVLVKWQHTWQSGTTDMWSVTVMVNSPIVIVSFSKIQQSLIKGCINRVTISMAEFSKVQKLLCFRKFSDVPGLSCYWHFSPLKFLGYCNSERSYQEGYKCGLSSIWGSKLCLLHCQNLSSSNYVN